jgi:protein ImuB
VGVGTIGGIARLPRKSLASRFDPQLSRRLSLFTGERPEPLAVPCSTELPTATHPFDVPLSLRDTTADDLAVILERLVEACLGPLAAAGKGVTALQVRLDRGQAIGLGEPSAPLVVDVGMFQPTSCVKHVVELVQLRMARLRLPREIVGITVDVVSAGQADCRQRTLFGEPAEASAAQVTMLLDRLSGRLGRRAVFEPLPLADAQPEHAWAAVPPMRATKRRAMPVPAPSSVRRRRGPQQHDGSVPAIAAAPQRRPLWMLPQPVRLESVVVAAAAEPCPTQQASAVVRPPAGFRLEGRMREVVKAHGPERIETAWWRGPTVRRDYYVVETSDGGRYWIFRRLGGSAGGSRRAGAERPAAQDGGAWFLHGMFS